MYHVLQYYNSHFLKGPGTLAPQKSGKKQVHHVTVHDGQEAIHQPRVRVVPKIGAEHFLEIPNHPARHRYTDICTPERALLCHLERQWGHPQARAASVHHARRSSVHDLSALRGLEKSSEDTPQGATEKLFEHEHKHTDRGRGRGCGWGVAAASRFVSHVPTGKQYARGGS